MRNETVTINLLDRLQELYSFKNPTEKQKDEYYKIDAILTRDFKRREYNTGDKVKLSPNPCAAHCGCFANKDKIDKFNLNKDEIYMIKHIHYFGGGCPPILLELEEVSLTHSYDNALPANWFKVVT